MGTLTKKNINPSTSSNSLVPRPNTSTALSPKQAKGYVELIGRSYYSFLQGASSPEEMVEQSIKLNYNGFALTDLHGMYGVVKGLQAAESPSHFTAHYKASKNYSYHIGSEIILADQTSLVLLPMNKEGYYNLCRLLTKGKRQAAKGYSKIHFSDLKEFSDNLVCFYLPNWNKEKYQELTKIYSGRLYLPIWRDLTWESRQICAKAFHLENELGAELFVTQRPFMHSPDKKALFDVVTCIHHGTTLEKSTDRLIQNGERYLRSLEELSLLWQDRLDLVEKTMDISRQLEFHLNDLRYRYPSSHLPPEKTPAEQLRDLTLKGAQKRYPQGIPTEVLRQIDYELEIIKDLEYEDYFLTLRDICDFADKKGILYQGRGSAANSVICFCLGLTAIDPINLNLLFERFISRERREPPDIDIDFEHERREEVIQYIYSFYGQERAAMVCTVIRYRSRMALRETAKVFGIPLETINRLIKYMGRDGLTRLYEPEISQKFHIPQDLWELMIQLTQQLKGFPRHLGIHSGGFLITHDPIYEMVPVEKATMEGRYVIQWNKDDIDYLKMMKIDVLSLGMLSCLRKAFDLLRLHKNIDLSLATIPQNCPKTYAMIQRAETVGVFQIESRAQMNTLPRMKPQNFYDLAIQIALIRPGPLQGGMVHPYLKLRQNPPEKIEYAHPSLEPILKKTLGIPIFQEQVMKIVVAVANFTPGESDELRRIMSSAWKRKASMAGVKERLYQGFQNNGVSPQYAEQIYNTIEGFSNYGFPESHSASFALITYASSWLKANHPDIFACALLNSQPMGFYEPRTIIQEAAHKGVRILDVDIQSSQLDYSLENVGEKSLALRVGLKSLYKAPSHYLDKILHARNLHGPFLHLKDFVVRTELPRSLLSILAASGAFKSFHANPRELLWAIEGLSLDKQSFLWGDSKELLSSAENLSAAREASANEEAVDGEHIPFESNWEKMKREYRSKGFSAHSHPMKVLRSYLDLKNEDFRRLRIIPYAKSSDLAKIPHKGKARVAGLLAITQRPPTAKGMCFLTLEDEEGFFNIVVKPTVYQQYRQLIYNQSLFEIHGTLERVQGVTNIIAEKLLPLS